MHGHDLHQEFRPETVLNIIALIRVLFWKHNIIVRNKLPVISDSSTIKAGNVTDFYRLINFIFYQLFEIERKPQTHV